jgi:hypothetical protein
LVARFCDLLLELVAILLVRDVLHGVNEHALLHLEVPKGVGLQDDPLKDRNFEAVQAREVITTVPEVFSMGVETRGA